MDKAMEDTAAAASPAAPGKKWSRRTIDLLFVWLDRSQWEKQIIILFGSIYLYTSILFIYI